MPTKLSRTIGLMQRKRESALCAQNLMRHPLITVAALVACAAAIHAVTGAPASSKPLDTANDAWERGDYVAALNGYIQLLTAPGGERWLEPIALTTGELYETRELTADGRAARQPGRPLHRV
jgi:hypothetical protein